MAFDWIAGRQGSGYEKMPLIKADWLPFDLYLLRYRPGSRIGSHVDPVPNRRHFRLNIYLRQALVGGEFRHGQVIFKNRFMTFFRPDISFHSVQEVKAGTRYVLSFGFVLKDK